MLRAITGSSVLTVWPVSIFILVPIPVLLSNVSNGNSGTAFYLGRKVSYVLKQKSLVNTVPPS